MNKKIIVCIVVSMIVVASVVAFRISRRDDDLDLSFKYYDEQESPEHIEDLFFPRRLTGKNEFTFDVPSYLQNRKLRIYSAHMGEYYGYRNITHLDQNGEVISSWNNSGGRGYARDGHDFRDFLKGVTQWTLRTEGPFIIMIYVEYDMTYMIGQPIDISFYGRTIGFEAWDGLYGVPGYDDRDNYYRFSIESDVPVKAYLFGKPSGMTDFYLGGSDERDEEMTTSKVLETGKSSWLGIANEPIIVISTYDDSVRQVNATLTIEIRDKGLHPLLVTALAISLVVIPTILVGVYIKKKEGKQG